MGSSHRTVLHRHLKDLGLPADCTLTAPGVGIYYCWNCAWTWQLNTDVNAPGFYFSDQQTWCLRSFGQTRPYGSKREKSFAAQPQQGPGLQSMPRILMPERVALLPLKYWLLSEATPLPVACRLVQPFRAALWWPVVPQSFVLGHEVVGDHREMRTLAITLLITLGSYLPSLECSRES